MNSNISIEIGYYYETATYHHCHQSKIKELINGMIIIDSQKLSLLTI